MVHAPRLVKVAKAKADTEYATLKKAEDPAGAAPDG